jgi:phosphomannomutase
MNAMIDLNLSMFRAYDIRTPSAQLTDELAVRLARAESVYFKESMGVSSVLIAHDARTSGPHYLELAAEEFARAGIRVIVVPGVCSTSMFYFSAMCHPIFAAVMYGASHNPAGDTGQKILGPGVRPIAEHIGPEGGLDKIKELYEKGAQPKISNLKSEISAFDPTFDYMQYSWSLAGIVEGDLANTRILHDYLNGAAGREMMLAFGITGAYLTPLHFSADGRFPQGDPNPVKQAVIKEGMETLKSGAFLFANFFDGDGDRLDVYRGDGTYLSSSFVYAAILPYIRPRFNHPNPGVYADLKCNPLAVMEMAKSGVRVEVIRNGHSQIKNSLFEDPSMIGAVEESAHFYEAFPPPDGVQVFGYSGIQEGRNSSVLNTRAPVHLNTRYCTENTLYIALLIARAWTENPTRFDRLFEIQSQTSREREWGYKFPSDDLRERALNAVQSHFESHGAKGMTRMPNGYDLEATMMRRGIPFEIDPNSKLSPDWLQVCQRISQSENGLARWEVVAANQDIASSARHDIAQIVNQFGAGEEYQG